MYLVVTEAVDSLHGGTHSLLAPLVDELSENHDPTYPNRFEEADSTCTQMLEDRAFQMARDGVAKLVLHNGRPVLVEGKKLYEVTYDNRLIMKLLASRDHEKYGEYKVVEVNWKEWDGDVSKLSPQAVKGLLAVLRQEAARQEAAREAFGNQSKRCRSGKGKDCGTDHGRIRGVPLN